MIHFANTLNNSYRAILEAMIENFLVEFNEFNEFSVDSSSSQYQYEDIISLFGSVETITLSLEVLLSTLKKEETYTISEYFYYLLYCFIELFRFSYAWHNLCYLVY